MNKDFFPLRPEISFCYTGINKHEGEAVGGFDTVITKEEYEKLYGMQQLSMRQKRVLEPRRKY